MALATHSSTVVESHSSTVVENVAVSTPLSVCSFCWHLLGNRLCGCREHLRDSHPCLWSRDSHDGHRQHGAGQARDSHQPKGSPDNGKLFAPRKLCTYCLEALGSFGFAGGEKDGGGGWDLELWQFIFVTLPFKMSHIDTFHEILIFTLL